MASKLLKPRTFTAKQMAERIAQVGYHDGRLDALQDRLEALEALVREWQASQDAISASAILALAERLQRLEADHVAAQRP